MPDPLRILAPFTAHSGYSKMARAVLRTAVLAGFDVEARESDYYQKIRILDDGRRVGFREYLTPKYPLPDCQVAEVEAALRNRVPRDAPTLMIQIPEALGAWWEYSSGPRIGWTMQESDRMNPYWSKSVEGVDLLLAPSRYCLNTFRRDSPAVTSELMPIPVDDRIWTTDSGGVGVSMRGMPPFLFISVFAPIPRKGWQLLMQAFGEEFEGNSKTVGLIVRPTRAPEVHELARWVKHFGVWISVIDTFQSDADLAAWYRASSCYALPSAEGFGLPYVEAALCGIPSVALDRGGAADVVTEETGYLVPSHFAPSVGQLPHIYPSDHRFPTCDVGELRLALRAAHVDGGQKGATARAAALAQFTPEVLAPRLREMVEDGCERFHAQHRMWSLPTSPKWALVVGDGYGDALAAMGNALHILRETGGTEIGILHYGFSKGVDTLCARQSFVREVKQSTPTSKEAFQPTADRGGADYATVPGRFLPTMLAETGIRAGELALTQAHWPWGTYPVHRPRSDDIVLSSEAEEWAEREAAELGRFILVQPYSTNSVDIDAHWYGWDAAIRWLLDNVTGIPLVFAGLEPLRSIKGRANAVDLVGKTPTMEHLMALTSRALGTVITCNALALWTAVRGVPSLVSANRAISRETDYYYRWIDCPPNTLLPYQASLADWETAARDWFAGLGVSVKAPAEKNGHDAIAVPTTVPEGARA